MNDVYIHPTAIVDAPCDIEQGTKVWHFCHLMKDCRIGSGCSLGQNVFVGAGVCIGSGVRIQNNVSLYSGVTIEDDVFIGPSAVFTNDINPRSFASKNGDYRPTLVQKGATIGANATVICGHTIGQYAMIGAGAVIVKDVPAHSVYVGNPARQIGWICTCGTRLAPTGTCPACGEKHPHFTWSRTAPAKASS